MKRDRRPDQCVVKMVTLHEPGDEVDGYRSYAAVMADGSIELLTGFRDAGDTEEEWDRDRTRFPPGEAAKLIAFIKSL